MRTKVGLDLDGIIIDLPPFIPKAVIDFFYEDKKSQDLHYRIPSLFEQKIRQFTHLPFIRPPLTNNLATLKEAQKSGKYEFYLITSRFGFLQNLTYSWLKKHQAINLFTKIYLNTQNKQPHLYKEEILKKVPVKWYLEDDFKCLMYLAPRFTKIHFYYFDKKGSVVLDKDNVSATHNLDTIFT